MRWEGLVLTLVLFSLQGCVSMHTPLEADEHYPQQWGALQGLGPECSSLSGNFSNQGVITISDGHTQPVLLTVLLGIKSVANVVLLSLQTQRLDKVGDTLATLQVVTHGDVKNTHNFQGCGCIKQTLLCPVRHGGGGFPPIFGGGQRGVIFSKSIDGSLIAMIQDYSIYLILAVPVFTISEPWARFESAGK